MATENKGPFSEFTINTAFPKAANDPSIQGKLTVIVDGQPVPATYSGWGPNAPTQGGSRPYYSIRINPTDPALAAEQHAIRNARMPAPPVPNPNAGLKLDTIGEGVLFATTPEEQADAAARGVKVRSFFGGAIVLTAKGPLAVDLSAIHRTGTGKDGKAYDFHSGWADPHDPAAAEAARTDKAARPAATAEIKQRKPAQG